MNSLKFALKRCYIFLNVYGAGRIQEWAILQQVVQDFRKRQPQKWYELWSQFSMVFFLYFF